VGFSIESPGFKDFARKLGKVDLGKVAHDATEAFAHEHLIPDLEDAARAAGASRALRDDIGFYHEDGDVFVGIPSDAPTHQEAVDLEYGTAVGAPSGWMRSVFAHYQVMYDRDLSAELTKKLAKAWAP
jgi:hypothetical protein